MFRHYSAGVGLVLSVRCGLVALWMSTHLRKPPLCVDMETVVRTALSRGYTAQGEMFSGDENLFKLF